MEKIRIRQIQISDITSVMDLKEAENWNQTVDDWEFLIKTNPNFCLIADFEDQVVGSITAINYQNKIAWIGMMLVKKKYRGKGISKLLLNTVIKKLKNCASIKLDATPAGIPVYQKLGFVKEYEIDRMVLLNHNSIYKDQPEATKYILSKISNWDISRIAKIDKMFFGANRYDLFQFLYKNRKENCLQINEDTKLNGYIFCRNGSNYVQLGPLVADSMQVAKKLLYGVFEKLKGQAIVVDVLSNKWDFKTWLFSKGFTFQRSFTRMYLKSNKYTGETKNQFLISGPELG